MTREDVLMAEAGPLAGRGQRARSTGRTAAPPLTLADEHACLLWQVTARAEELLTATAHGWWPGAELTALAGYAQAEVLHQAADEEALLFPAASSGEVISSQEVTRLARDHARLRSAADLLARAAAGEQPMSLTQAATAARDFAAQLQRHLRAEEELLAAGCAPRGAPATVTLGGRCHDWYPLTEGPVVDLDAVPPGQAVAAAVDRLLRMHHGEQAELRSGADLNPVWRELDELSPGGYRFTVLEDGPARWRMRVTRHVLAS